MEGLAAERYFRTWEREGRRQLDAKLALQFDEYDEQRTGRLQHLEWDDHHCTYDEDYTFETADEVPTGAWTLDCDREAIRALRERDIRVPDRDEIPLAVDAHLGRASEVDRECRACHTPSVVSTQEARAVYPGAERGTALTALLEAENATHLCAHCRRFYRFELPDSYQEQTHARDIEADLSEAM